MHIYSHPIVHFFQQLSVFSAWKPTFLLICFDLVFTHIILYLSYPVLWKFEKNHDNNIKPEVLFSFAQDISIRIVKFGIERLTMILTPVQLWHVDQGCSFVLR